MEQNPTTAQVWIEIERSPIKGENQRRAQLLNRILWRLTGQPADPPPKVFYWSDKDSCYCFGGDDGYITLSDNGLWLDLEDLASPTT